MKQRARLSKKFSKILSSSCINELELVRLYEEDARLVEELPLELVPPRSPRPIRELLKKQIEKYLRTWQNSSIIRILDVGCGPKPLYLFSFREKSITMVGLDISKTLCKVANREAKVHALSLMTVCGTAEQLPFPQEWFHIVICSETVEHLLCPSRGLAELRRVLRKDGFLILTTPNRMRIDAILRRLIALVSFGRVSMKQRLDESHVVEFDIIALKKLLLMSKLRVHKILTVGYEMHEDVCTSNNVMTFLYARCPKFLLKIIEILIRLKVLSFFDSHLAVVCSKL
jgi:2-polyprenyl-3-methyl-5-hydroxy-6-metoxy-1,4-benzoquinol methylase